MSKSKPFHTTRKTIFAYGNYGLDKVSSARSKILLTTYCKLRYITRDTLYTLIKKHWVEVTKSKGRIYVRELCPEKIENYLV